MSEYYHVVPWYNSEEWQRVYDEISNTSTNKEDALRVLLVWKARSPFLPSGIESTLSLLQVYVEDTEKAHDVQNDQLLRLAYSSAIMRFVNHMLDTETVKGTSLYQAAKTLGVPDWIVDLRHDTAHSNTLPPLTLLREACSISLKWLQKNYWDKHKQYIQDYITVQKDIINGEASKISALINFCITIGICAHSKLKIKNLSEIPNMTMRESIVNDANELLGDLIDLSNLKTVSVMSLINILNAHGKKLLKFRDASKYVNETLLGDESLFLSRELLYFFSASDFKYRNKLYASYVQCFEVLLTFLHTNDLLLDFIMALIKVTQNQDSGTFKARLAALWLSEILAALKASQSFLKKIKKNIAEGNTSTKKKDLKNLYEQWFPSNSTGNNLMLDLQKPVPVELQDISYIQPIITAYNPYLTYYIKNLLELLELSLPIQVAERICLLAKIIASPEQFPMSTSSTIYTLDDLQMANDDAVVIVNIATQDNKNEDQDDKNEDQGNKNEDQDDKNEDQGNKNEDQDNKNEDQDNKNKDQDNKIEDQDNKIEDQDYQKLVINKSIWKLASKEHNWSTCPIGQVPWHNNFNTVVEMETNQV